MADQAAALGKRGILLFERAKSAHGGSVLTLWNGKETAEPSQDLFGESAEVLLWETIAEDEGGGKGAHGHGRAGKGHQGHAHAASHGGH